jgi:RNA polymerase sigma-70 factor (ECF subfamily)
MPDSDDALVARIRERDDEAFRTLFDRYYTRIFSFSNRRLNDAALCEEVTGDVFFEVWRSVDAFRGASKVSTWLFGIATFKCLEADRNRRRHKRAAVIPTQDEILQQAPDDFDTLGQVEARSELRAIRGRIDALPEGQREVALLALFEGRSNDEIASELGISSGTVKSRLSRARRELRGRPPLRGEARR